ncbi:putative reverse transcriptase domain-containing protein [Tanacetum coccineum]|uniref:Reverse transcriptase domain-containing protein n=1 Tax=Tanacetum coccineum TaxID=301880 RepID=A0ABQ4XF20_9ASTR
MTVSSQQCRGRVSHAPYAYRSPGYRAPALEVATRPAYDTTRISVPHTVRYAIILISLAMMPSYMVCDDSFPKRVLILYVSEPNRALWGILVLIPTLSGYANFRLWDISYFLSRCDSSLFIYQYGTEVAYLLVYVDDIVLTASSTALLQHIISSLHKEFDMKILGALHYFLGISVTQDARAVMSSLTVTYTSVYSDSEPWRFQWVSDDELEAPVEAPQFSEQTPPSPDYVPGPKHPPSPDYVPGPEHPPSPDYVPGPEYPEYLLPSDDEEEEEEEDKEEEEHLAPDDSTTLPVVDPVPSSRAASPSPVPPPRLRRARISIRPQTPMSAATEALIAADVPEADVPPQKRLCLTAPALRLMVGRSFNAVLLDAGLVGTFANDYKFWLNIVDATPNALD